MALPVSIVEKSPTPHGVVSLEICYSDGRKEVIVVENRVVAQGRDLLLRNAIGIHAESIDFIVFSNDASVPSDGETAMPGTWVFAVPATKSRPAPQQVRWSATLDGGASGVSGNTVGSIGLCTNANGAGLFARVKLPSPIRLAAGVLIHVHYDVTMT
jgi:hypothetical protein